MGETPNGASGFGNGNDDTPSISPNARLKRACGGLGLALAALAATMRQVSLSSESLDRHKLALTVRELRDKLDESLLILEMALEVMK